MNSHPAEFMPEGIKGGPPSCEPLLSAPPHARAPAPTLGTGEGPHTPAWTLWCQVRGSWVPVARWGFWWDMWLEGKAGGLCILVCKADTRLCRVVGSCDTPQAQLTAAGGVGETRQARGWPHRLLLFIRAQHVGPRPHRDLHRTQPYSHDVGPRLPRSHWGPSRLPWGLRPCHRLRWIWARGAGRECDGPLSLFLGLFLRPVGSSLYLPVWLCPWAGTLRPFRES